MSKGIDEQLAVLFGKEIPPKNRKKNRITLTRVPKSHLGSEGASRHLDNVYHCLEKISRGDSGAKTELQDLAYIAGMHKLQARHRENEAGIVKEAVTQILAEHAPDRVDVRRQLLGAASLAYSEPLKQQLREVLVEYALNGVFALHGHFGKTSRDEAEFIAHMAGRKQFEDALSHAEQATREEERRRVEAAKRGAEKEQRLHQEAVAQFKNKLKTLYRDLSASPYSHKIEVQKLDTNDLLLIATWANLPNSNIQEVNDLAVLIEKNELTRLWSARIGERAAIQFFSGFSRSVEDISLTQLDSHAREWMTHDLVVDDLPYDVKNARRSFSSPKSYSNHCVPEFKQLVRRGTEVAITGVLSDYLTIEQVHMGATGTSTILGNVTRAEISELADWFTDRFSGLFELPALSEITFLPGWIFEYPDTYQPHRREAQKKASAFLREASEAGNAKMVPAWVAAFEDDRKILAPFITRASDHLIWEHLRAVDNQIGLSRRTLFLAILGSTLQQATDPSTAYNPRDWIRWLYADRFVDHDVASHPLGLIDSEQYIRSLITTLENIWNRSRDHLSRFRRFRLTHPAILKGEDDSGDWHTLIAYCGGWRSSPPRAKCGKHPLYMGESDWCPECYHLICTACGHCSKFCSQNVKRQREWIKPVSGELQIIA